MLSIQLYPEKLARSRCEKPLCSEHVDLALCLHSKVFQFSVHYSFIVSEVNIFFR